MKKKPENQSVFPIMQQIGEVRKSTGGIDIRMLIAIHAMAAQIGPDTNPAYVYHDGEKISETIAKNAFLMADAMLEASQS